jgi:hypothetical protein
MLAGVILAGARFAGSRFAVPFESGAPFSHANATMAVASTSIGKRIDLSSKPHDPEEDNAAGVAKHVACHRSTIGKPPDRALKSTNNSRRLQQFSIPQQVAEGAFASRRADFAPRRTQLLR